MGAETFVWIVFVIYYILIVLFGSLILFNKKRKRKVDLKEVVKFYWIIVVLKFVDVLTTINFTYKLGIRYEANIIARDIMYQFGIVPGMILFFMSSMVLMFFWFTLMNFLCRGKMRFAWIIFKWVMIATCIIVPIYNLLITKLIN